MGEFTEQILRFVHYALLLGLFGWTAFRVVGLRGQNWVRHDWGGHMLIGAALAAPVASLALMLASIAAMMGAPIASLDWPMTEAMIVGTDIGMAFLVRATLLVIGLCALFVQHRTAVGLPIATACFAGALMTLGWSGHAAATEGGLGLFHRLNNSVHLLAAGLWIGAIAWFLLLTAKAHRQPDLVPAHLLLRVVHRFAPLGVGLVTIVSLTGLINAHLIFGLENSASVLTTSYGALLVSKFVLVGGMLVFGAHNARIGRRGALNDLRMKAELSLAQSYLRRSLAGELMLAIGVIGLVAALGTMSPMMM